jgi:hypothetical protein
MVSKEKVTYSAFYERFSALTDDRIMNILKNQNDYQEAARNAAIQIATERALIHSSDDLLGPEFQNNRSTQRSLFPSMPNDYHHNRLLGSIFRFLFVFSLLPVIYGVIQYAKGNLNFAIAATGSGLIWFALVFLMKRSGKTTFIFPLFALLFIVGLFLGYKLINQSPFKFMDIFMLLVGILLPSYFLFYARKLLLSK